MEDDRRVRIVFMGSGRVGKTGIIRQFLRGHFEEKYHPTVEDIYSQQFEVHNQCVEVDMMDTSGSYNFPAMRRICICRASAVVLVFALDNPHSFIEVTELYDQVRTERAVDFSTTPIIVCCNKCDLPPDAHLITTEMIESWQAQVNLRNNCFVLSSAKTGEGVREVFEKLWLQNEASGRFRFDRLPSVPEYDFNKRRSSAFAVLGSSCSSSLLPKPVLTTGSDRSGDKSPSRSPRRLFKNTFTSHRRASTKVTSNISGNNRRMTQPTKKLDCNIS